jgi:hypothetical protein
MIDDVKVLSVKDHIIDADVGMGNNVYDISIKIVKQIALTPNEEYTIMADNIEVAKIKLRQEEGKNLLDIQYIFVVPSDTGLTVDMDEKYIKVGGSIEKKA